MQEAQATAGNNTDAEYHAYLGRVRARFQRNTTAGPVFTTSVTPQSMWEAYLQSFPEAERQHHNCNACRHFIQRFGGLVVIDPFTGWTLPAVWAVEDAYGPYTAGVDRMVQLVARAKVTGVFLSPEKTLGFPVTGQWHHLHAINQRAFSSLTNTAGQAMAAKRQDFHTLRRGLEEFDRGTVAQAVLLLESGTLHRAEKVMPMAKWLFALHEARQGKAVPDNLTWHAVATAPDGYCTPRSGALGFLMEEIAKGSPVDVVKRKFDAAMDEYQRPTSAPKVGQIEAAERAVEAMGIAPSFARRYVTANDIAGAGIVWLPSDYERRAAAEVKAGVFGHLKTDPSPGVPQLAIPPKKMTWEKFARDVLPGAAVIEYRVPMVGPFCALTTAQDPEAPQILQWENPVSWSFPSPAARAEDWSLAAGTLAKVRMIVRPPSQWGERRLAHQADGAFLLLDGAHDNRGQPGGGLFPEHLKSELHPYRSTIEAHMNKLTVAGADDPAAIGFGVGLMAGTTFTEAAAPKQPTMTPGAAARAPERIHVIFVLDDSGSMRDHIGAARQAVASLASAVRMMPGRVDVTVVRFGSQATTLLSRAGVDQLEGIERQLHGASGGTALNDTLQATLLDAIHWEDADLQDTSFFLGIVTDGKDEGSRRFSPASVRSMVQRVQATGRWTIAFAGAAARGYHPAEYASSIGIPQGNVKVFEASERGFEDVGASYAASTATLSQGYTRGARASTSFFAAAPGRQAIGKDHPVLIVTSKSGAQSAYELDRWD
ncbi:MAG: Phage protein [Variovorax sp.]|nr:Phage protein [Variovorax sp.]